MLNIPSKLIAQASLLIPVLLYSFPMPLNAQNGWRQSGYNGSRTNNSPSTGPASQPTFQPLITNAPGNLSRIAKDGSLLLSDGSHLSYFSTTGVQQWSMAVGFVDVAIGPTGIIYTSGPGSITAWSPDTGQPVWPSPFIVSNSGNETTAMAIDSQGTIYLVSGSSYFGPDEKVVAANSNGTLKWQSGILYRGYVQFVLSTNESIGYISGVGGEHGVSTTTGLDVYGPTGLVANTWAYAPWNVLYVSGPNGLDGNNGIVACDFIIGCQSLSLSAGVAIDGVATLIPPGIIVTSGNYDGKLRGIDRSGNLLWVASEPLGSVISDSAGRMYAIAPQTSDVVAMNGSTGAQLWRQHFASTPTSLLLGDDGSLYTNVGSSLLKSTPTKPIVIVVPGFGASTLTDVGQTDQWLSCSSIISLGNGYLNPMQYHPTAAPTLPTPVLPLNPSQILTQSDSLTDPTIKPSNQSVIQCSTDDLATVACTAGLWNCFKAYAAAKVGARSSIQSHIADAVLQFNDLLASLTANGFTTVPWPYDFRHDISTLANDLDSAIQQISVAYPGRKIAIVTHSEGTLVTAAMIAQHRERYDSGLLSHIISMGPPFNGAIATYLYVQGWDHFTPFLSNANTKLLGQYWPSVYQLLPQWPFVTLFSTTQPVSPQITDIFKGTGVTKLPQLPRADLVPDLTNPASLWGEINTLGLLHRWYAIIGQGQQTANQIAERFNSPSQTKPCLTIDLEDGDGTVPLRSSQAGGIVPGANQIYVIDKHTHLPRNTDVIKGIVNLLSGVSPFTGTNLSAFPTVVVPSDALVLNACSPISLTVTDSAGDIINAQVSQIPNATFANIADATQITLPWNDTFQVQIVGTGTGTFDLLVNGLGGQHSPLSYFFKGVPVLTGSQGTVVIGGTSVPALQYNYAGKNVVDTIPANTTPPTVVCTGCYFTIQNLRATLAFNAGYLGGVSTFSYNYRSSSQAVQFISTATSQISVSGNTATFSGQGTLNGQAGYSFAVTAKDGGPAGSGLDSVTVLITGPNNYSYSVSSAIVGGDVVVHP